LFLAENPVFQFFGLEIPYRAPIEPHHRFVKKPGPQARHDKLVFPHAILFRTNWCKGFVLGKYACGNFSGCDAFLYFL